MLKGTSCQLCTLFEVNLWNELWSIGPELDLRPTLGVTVSHLQKKFEVLYLPLSVRNVLKRGPLANYLPNLKTMFWTKVLGQKLNFRPTLGLTLPRVLGCPISSSFVEIELERAF